MNRYKEEDLIIPALFEILKNNRQITTTTLISKLTEKLKPEGEDLELLQDRNDTKFSQKVRNLISHKKIYPKYTTYDEENHLLYLTNEGLDYLIQTEYYELNKDELEDEETEVNSTDLKNVPKVVSCEPQNYSCFDLHRRYKNNNNAGSVILDNSIQRNNVWSPKQKSCLIESLIIGIPIPMIYVFEDINSNFIVIDGKQRLNAIFDYMDNKYALKNLEFLGDNLNNKKFSDLNNELSIYRSRIEATQLRLIIIKSDTEEIFKLKTFERINQSVTKLTPQELRHALHQGACPNLLKRISDKEVLFSLSYKTRMKDRLFVLRYISIRLFYLNKLYDSRANSSEGSTLLKYKEINSFLAVAMDTINTFTSSQIQEIEDDFWFSYNKAKNIFKDSAFKLDNSSEVYNMIIFEITLLIISLTKNMNLSDNQIFNLLENYKNSNINIIENSQPYDETPFMKNIKYHRDSKANFYERMEWLKKIISNANNDQKT